ncbi:dynamin family protein [Sphingobium estronivorans]|uniref:dynamin family protein n=1 Tax=Sphingobium estronivorans TaxID=1577690 RepID=UPI0013C329CB|nr:dynamin family protein [Sphingobium estronivorans]
MNDFDAPPAAAPPATPGSLLDQLAEDEPSLTSAERATIARLMQLDSRVIAGRFQLAVIGQFKRGKSTLLNALLGLPVLPTGVVPLTAIPTFIAHGDEPGLEIAFEHKPPERHRGDTIPALRERLAEVVTETGNPHNARQVSRVLLTLPAPLLAEGLVMIDTPGIGSAERHNSEAALAALPDCDAALIVLSPDPPVTEAEIAYLALVKEHAARIVPVLNKIDIIDAADRATIEAYVSNVLARTGVVEPLSITAAGAVPPLGIGELTARIRALWSERADLLGQAAELKRRHELSDLVFQNDVALAALRLPLETLDAKLALIGQAIERIVREHDIAGDLTSGERQRLRDRIDGEAEDMKLRAREHLRAVLDATPHKTDRDAFQAIANASSAFFEDAYRGMAAATHANIEAIISRARERFQPTLERVRQVAAEAFGIPFSVPELEIEIAPPRELAWVERQAESMNPVPPGLFDGLLPGRWRERRRRARLLAEIDRIVTLNTEHLRWTLRQQAEEILRAFDRELDARLALAARSVTELAAEARHLRSGTADATAREIAARERRFQLLQTLVESL